jgi:endonuclease/exonuclease/phosphatase family metal-dependent hydrolase
MLIAMLVATSVASAGDIKIVTLNTWGLPAPVAPDRAGRLGKASSWLDGLHADIIGLEEVWYGARSFLSIPGLHLPEIGGDSGLGLVSPHSVAGLDLHAYKTAHGFDRWKSKGLLHATVAFPEGDVAVYVTHLQAGDHPLDSAVRSEQITELLAGISGSELPTIVMGDFNLYTADPSDDDNVARLVGAGFLDVAASAGVVDPTYPGYDDRYDRIYVRDGGGSHWTVLGAEVGRYDADPTTSAPERLSDHYPVTARMHLEHEAVVTDIAE